jgi:hypothetical protein
VNRYLIDHKGTVWTYPAEGLGEAHGYPQPDFDIWSYAIRNLGAVEVAVGSDLTTVTMRSATAKATAVEVAEKFLTTLNSNPVRLRYEIGSWIEETCENPEQAAGRMANALAESVRDSHRIAFSAKARNLEMLGELRLNRLESNEERLGLIYKKWRLSNGLFDAETPYFLVRFGLIDRAVIANEAQSSRELVFSHAGVGLNLYDKHDSARAWSFAVVGSRVEDQPDPDYGRWVAQTYRSVLSENRPRFDFIDAVVQPPAVEPYRTRYDRLLLPWHQASGERLVTAVSFKTTMPAMAA